jgi:hypothetical protein
MRKLSLLLLLLGCMEGFAQNITQIEYFIDTDPGYGLATPISGYTSSTNVNGLNFGASLSAVSSGIHRIQVRAKDSNENWSVVNSQVFYKDVFSSGGPLSNIVRIEYFIDSDPGYGLGTEITGYTLGTNINGLSFTTPVTALAAGIHRIQVRAKDAFGNWSVVNSMTFYRDQLGSGAALTNINRIEYFIDNDPGYGSATEITGYTPGTNVAGLNFTVPLNTVTDGIHKLQIRARDANGNWSVVNSVGFYKDALATATLSNITKIEYFVDTDPGYGSGTDVPFSAGVNTTNLNFSFPVSSFSSGLHKLFIRAKNSGNSWSVVGIKEFSVQNNGVALNDFPSSWCTSNTITVPFTSSGIFTATNEFKVQLSYNGGSFPGDFTSNIIGTVNSNSASGYITLEIPGALGASAGEYKVRILATDPAVPSGTDAFAEELSFSLLSTCPCTTPIITATGNTKSAFIPDNVDYDLVGNDCGILGTVNGQNLNNATTPFTAKVIVDPAVQSYSGQPYLQRHFELTPGGTSPTSAEITLYVMKSEMIAFNAASSVKLPAEVTDAKTELRIWQWHGTAVSGAPDVVIDPADADITWDAAMGAWKIKFAVTGFSSFYVTANNATPLPVTLLEFNAKKQEKSVLLDWQTTEETNSDRFEIQHSSDAKRWSMIGTITSHGESNELQKYTFTHLAPNTGENLYRLKMLDLDGTFAYSRIVAASFEEILDVFLYPNPVSGKVTMSSTIPISGYKLISITGQVLRELFEQNSNSISMSLQGVYPGLYFVQLSLKNGKTEFHKLIVQ